MRKLQIMRATRKTEGTGTPVTPKQQRTCIEELSAVGYELSEAHLRLVSGGLLG